MNYADLIASVEKSVLDFMQQGSPFTLVDISHPLIQNDNSIRHRQVRDIVNDLVSNGVIAFNNYTWSFIQVMDTDGTSKTARLFHPDDPMFNIFSYTNTNQVLDRSGDSGTPQLPLSNPVSSQLGAPSAIICKTQNARPTVLNIPNKIVAEAGFLSGDRFDIYILPNDNTIQIKKSSQGAQSVDKEGRIRLNYVESSNYKVTLRDENNEKIIEVKKE